MRPRSALLELGRGLLKTLCKHWQTHFIESLLSIVTKWYVCQCLCWISVVQYSSHFLAPNLSCPRSALHEWVASNMERSLTNTARQVFVNYSEEMVHLSMFMCDFGSTIPISLSLVVSSACLQRAARKRPWFTCDIKPTLTIVSYEVSII